MSLAHLLIILFISVCNGDAYAISNVPKTRIVITLQGPVLGYQDPVGPFVFYDIPYATAPTGIYKFRLPLPPPTWPSIFEALDRRVACPQNPGNRPLLETISEDCLVASVYVPDTNRTNLPVYVMIHGGAYQYGSSNRNTPKEFVKSKEIVAVTFNYRLGVHGLLCLGTKNVPGNAGLKDQVAALRWIKANIARFGGNPEDVTLSGSSAGASSADLLMLSRSAEGLFNKVVIQSGANVAAWSSDQEPLIRAKKFAKSFNFHDGDDINALEHFYTHTPLEDLTSIPEMFAPCVERDLGEETFLDQAPVDIIKSGNYNKIPMLYGFCDKEGLMKIILEDRWEPDRQVMNEKFSDFLPPDLHFETEDEKEAVAKRVKEFYFGEKLVDVETVEGFIDIQSDILFIYPMLKAVKLHLEAGHDQLFLYEYAFPTEHLLFENLISITGATHTAQTRAVADDYDDFSEEYRQMKVVMRDLWYNFVSTGTPVPPDSTYPAWPPASSPSRFPYMLLNTTLSLRHQFQGLTERTRLWDELYAKYYRSPGPPIL